MHRLHHISAFTNPSPLGLLCNSCSPFRKFQARASRRMLRDQVRQMYGILQYFGSFETLILRQSFSFDECSCSSSNNCTVSVGLATHAVVHAKRAWILSVSNPWLSPMGILGSHWTMIVTGTGRRSVLYAPLEYPQSSSGRPGLPGLCLLYQQRYHCPYLARQFYVVH